VFSAVEVDSAGRRLEGLIEQAQLLLLRQDAQNGTIHVDEVGQPVRDAVGELEERVAGGEFDVDACREREACRCGTVDGDSVHAVQEHDGEVVGDDDAIEPPTGPKDVGQVSRGAADGLAIDLCVRVHD